MDVTAVKERPVSSNPNTQSPVNPLPPVVVALFLVIVGVEAAFSLGAKGFIGGPGALGWRNSAIQTYGFNSDIMGWMFANGRFPQEHMIRFVSYIFVHGDFTHALFGGAMILALGKFVGDVFNQWATLALVLISSIVGALVFGLIAPEQPWLTGAFPGVYGLIGGFTYLMWLKLGILRILARLVLELRHPLHPAHPGDAVENPRHLRVLGHLRLVEQD